MSFAPGRGGVRAAPAPPAGVAVVPLRARGAGPSALAAAGAVAISPRGGPPPALYRHVVSCEEMNESQRPTMEDAHVTYDDLSAALPRTAPAACRRGGPRGGVQNENAPLSNRSAPPQPAGKLALPRVEAAGARMKPTSLFALFDGHGGRDVVDFAAARFAPNLAALIADVDAGRRDMSVEQAIAAAYLLTDVQSHQERHESSGTTVVTVVLRAEDAAGAGGGAGGGGRVTMYASNAGDSRAVLCRDGRAIRLTRDHKADDPDEVKRVAAAGGFVMRRRVCGVLAVTRAIGDHALKPYVVAAPHMRTMTLRPQSRGGGDEFVILACDGVWDVISDEEAVALVLSEGDDDGDAAAARTPTARGAPPSRERRAAARLVRESIRRRSTDNITAIVVFL